MQSIKSIFFCLDALQKVELIRIVATAFFVADGVNTINIVDGFYGVAVIAAISMPWLHYAQSLLADCQG